MKISVKSDIHLEFRNYSVKNSQDADVLVLAGDICIGSELANTNELSPKSKQGQVYRDFFKECVDKYKNVIYVAGNHEFYHGRFNRTLDDINNICADLGVHFLENNTVYIDKVPFIGATLWTSLDKANPMMMETARGYMNDYKVIKYDGADFRKLSPKDTVNRHKDSMKYLRAAVQGLDKCVVVTHHAPCSMSVHNIEPVSHAYFSDLSEFVLDNPQIKYWIHGHVHDRFEYELGSTKVVCNCNGYPGEMDDPVDLIIEV